MGCKSHRLDHCRSELIHAAALRRGEGTVGPGDEPVWLYYTAAVFKLKYSSLSCSLSFRRAGAGCLPAKAVLILAPGSG